MRKQIGKVVKNENREMRRKNDSMKKDVTTRTDIVDETIRIANMVVSHKFKNIIMKNKDIFEAFMFLSNKGTSSLYVYDTYSDWWNIRVSEFDTGFTTLTMYKISPSYDMLRGVVFTYVKDYELSVTIPTDRYEDLFGEWYENAKRYWNGK